MKKTEILDELRSAKAAHVNWMQRAKLLIEGLDISEDSIPVNSTECHFGKWFYSTAQKLNGLRNNSIEDMRKIEVLHSRLHETYLNIFKIYYAEPNKSFFAKLFSLKKKITQDDADMAAKYFVQIKSISDKLVDEISVLERRVAVISDEELSELV